ncbi:hypothetical protein [Ferviditalea candida]|uniref:Uncharacterized protein n=1 Tax=Ferviditalea candida TaxID=3108399 RepID=A0ABU5ZNE0_9BACL|nr:hypothetical protein [Paenibacillaceae bacterium T2]
MAHERRKELGTRIAERIFAKLELADNRIYEDDAVAFLIAIYNQVKEDWQL